MKSKVQTAARYILGLLFFVFGLNGFLNFIPPPATAFPDAAMNYMNGLMGSGYFFPVLKGTETLCGLLLLSGFLTPLALIILAPITIQIFLFHAILTPGLAMIVLPVVIIVLHVTAATRYWPIYRQLLSGLDNE